MWSLFFGVLSRLFKTECFLSFQYFLSFGGYAAKARRLSTGFLVSAVGGSARSVCNGAGSILQARRNRRSLWSKIVAKLGARWISRTCKSFSAYIFFFTTGNITSVSKIGRKRESEVKQEYA